MPPTPHHIAHPALRLFLLIYLLPGIAVGLVLAGHYFRGVTRQRLQCRTPWSYLLGLAWLFFLAFVLHAEVRAHLHLSSQPGIFTLLGFLAVPFWWTALCAFLLVRRQQRQRERAAQIAPNPAYENSAGYDPKIVLPLPPARNR